MEQKNNPQLTIGINTFEKRMLTGELQNISRSGYAISVELSV